MKKGIGLLFMTSFLLMGCSSFEEGTYQNDRETVQIDSDGVVQHIVPLNTLSSTIEQYVMTELDDDQYGVNTEEGLAWLFILNKEDPEYELYMNEMSYYIDIHGFEVEDGDEDTRISGQVTEAMQNDLNMTFNESYRILEYVGEGISVDGVVFVESSE